MTDDFEVHPIGTFQELEHYKKIVNSIQQITEQYGNGIVPEPVFRTYSELKIFQDKMANVKYSHRNF